MKLPAIHRPSRSPGNQSLMVIAGVWGALLPIEVVHGLPSASLDLARYLSVALIWTSYPPRPERRRDRELEIWAAMLLSIAVLAGVTSLIRGDSSTTYVVGVLLASLAGALVVCRRPPTIGPALVGFLCGATLSAVVVVMQAIGLPTLAPANAAASRHPGLASSTVIASWHLAIAATIGTYLAILNRGRRAWMLAALGSAVLCLVALVLCGTQGGVLGIAFAGLALAVHLRSRIRRQHVRALVAIAAGIGVLLYLAAIAGLPTVAGMLPEAGYENELARLDLAEGAFDSLRSNPWTGESLAEFKEVHNVPPHFFPLTIGITTGVLGVVLASLPVVRLVLTIVRGPVDHEPDRLLGCTLAAMMLAYTLVEPAGPYVGLNRLPLLLIGVLMCRGLLSAAGDDTTGDESQHQLTP